MVVVLVAVLFTIFKVDLGKKKTVQDIFLHYEAKTSAMDRMYVKIRNKTVIKGLSRRLTSVSECVDSENLSFISTNYRAR